MEVLASGGNRNEFSVVSVILYRTKKDISNYIVLSITAMACKRFELRNLNAQFRLEKRHPSNFINMSIRAMQGKSLLTSTELI